MYYFAYGSNMVREHMRRLCGRHSIMLSRALLPHYELGVDLRGYATIRQNKLEHVYGILYEIDEIALDTLDHFEGYPNVFGRTKVTVKDEEHNEYEVWVYMEPEDQFGGEFANQDYFQRAIASARENRLPAKWIKKLEGFIR